MQVSEDSLKPILSTLSSGTWLYSYSPFVGSPVPVSWGIHPFFPFASWISSVFFSQTLLQFPWMLGSADSQDSSAPFSHSTCPHPQFKYNISAAWNYIPSFRHRIPLSLGCLISQIQNVLGWTSLLHLWPYTRSIPFIHYLTKWSLIHPKILTRNIRRSSGTLLSTS